jgi:hypothetical protein
MMEQHTSYHSRSLNGELGGGKVDRVSPHPPSTLANPLSPVTMTQRVAALWGLSLLLQSTIPPAYLLMGWLSLEQPRSWLSPGLCIPRSQEMRSEMAKVCEGKEVRVRTGRLEVQGRYTKEVRQWLAGLGF